MKKLLLVVVVLVIALIGAWYFGLFKGKDKPSGPKPEGLTVSKHSNSFNESMSNAMNSYYALTESFVNWDTAKINTSLAEFKISVIVFGYRKWKKILPFIQLFKVNGNRSKQRLSVCRLIRRFMKKEKSLNMLSQQLFDLLRIVKYDAAKVYYQECPMALNNYESSAFWLSTEGDNKKRRNPYLGLHDPKYGKAMLTCGATRDSINFATSPAGN